MFENFYARAFQENQKKKPALKVTMLVSFEAA
jgi:hypothetical protein